jgi:hypothetical protein
MRYSIREAERIRKDKDLTPEQFSVVLGYSPRAYPAALNLERLTPRMAKEIAVRFQIPLRTMGLVEVS